MTMRWRGRRRDSLQADIRAYSRYRYAVSYDLLFLLFPLAPASSESYSGPLHNLLPPRDVASAEWNLLLRFRAGNASSNSHTLILRYLCASVSTRVHSAPLNITLLYSSPANLYLPLVSFLFLFSFFFFFPRFEFEMYRKREKKKKDFIIHFQSFKKNPTIYA